MTKEELAKLMDGREYREEITPTEEALASSAGLVVVFGASDDLAEFRGAICDEQYADRETPIYISGNKVLDKHNEYSCDCPYCGFDEARKRARLITADFTNQGWTFSTEIPHAKFNIKEMIGDVKEQYGEGIVFEL